MVATFARLKLSLLSGVLQSGTQRGLALVISGVVVLPVALLVGGWLATSPFPDPALAFVGVGGVTAIGWALLPALSFASDDTLDPARLRTAPLSRRALAVGLGTASAIGLAPTATVLVLGGAAIAVGREGLLAAAVAPIALAAQAVLCVLLARTIVTALAGVLRSRRGRDLTLVVSAIGMPVAVLLPQFFLRADAVVSAKHAAQALEALRLTPFGWAPNAAAAAADGHALAAAGWLAASVALLVVLAAAWIAALERSLTSAEGTTTAQGGAALLPRGLRWLPAGATTAALGRELRTYAAEPQRRQALVLLGLLPLVGLAVGVANAVTGTPALAPPIVLAPIGVPLFIFFMSGLNIFAADRGAVWLPVLAGRLRTELVGKHLAAAVLAVPAATAGAAGLAVGAGGWHLVPVAAVGTLIVLMPALGVGAVPSVTAPWPLPRSATNLSGGAQGQGCAVAFAQFTAMVALALLAAPAAAVAVPAVLAGGPWIGVAAVVVAAYAVGVWVSGIAAATRLAQAYREHLVLALSD